MVATQIDHGSGQAAAISNMVVHVMRRYLGRGPTGAKTTITPDFIAVVMRDILLQAETSLVKAGEADRVLETRHRFQMTMRTDLVAGVERITGRKVRAFLSDNHLNPDLAVEMFVMEEGKQDGPALSA